MQRYRFNISFLLTRTSSPPPLLFACAIRVRESNRKQGGPVHRTEKTSSDPLCSRIVSYCSIGIYVPDTRFAPSSATDNPAKPSCSILDVHCAISGEIVERTGIKLYRISDSLRSGNTRSFGNWRTVENISTTYSFAKLLGWYVIARYVSNESCQWKCLSPSLPRLDGGLGFFFVFYLRNQLRNHRIFFQIRNFNSAEKTFWDM